MEAEREYGIGTRMVVGVALLVMGTLLLLDNAGLITVGPVWEFWPLIIVGVGVAKIIQAPNAKDRGKGVWLTFLGTWLFVSLFHLFGLGFSNSWPILLVGWGIAIVWRSLVDQSRTDLAEERSNGN